MNNCNLTGRIGQDPTVHVFDNGEKQTSFSLAVDNGYYSKEKSEWINRTVWINVVKRGESKLIKGDLIEVSGKLNVRNYDNKDGQKVYITEVIAFSTALLNRKKDSAQPVENTAPTEQSIPHDASVGSDDSDLPY